MEELAPSIFQFKEFQMKYASVKGKVADLFGIKTGAQVSICEPSDEEKVFVPEVNPDFVFGKDFLQSVLPFLTAPHGDALWVYGPTGSGKTEGILQTAARLNWPVAVINCSDSTEMEDEIGSIGFIVKDGHTESIFNEGALLKAVRNGWIVLFNEYDLLKPAQAAFVNDIIEGRPLTVKANGGEQVRPHPMFRLIVTANSNGYGDMSGLYRGVRQQNLAALDRFRSVKVDYPSAEVEKMILSKYRIPCSTSSDGYKYLPEEIIDGMIQLASDTRKAFVGDGSGNGALTKTFSTRSLCRWAYRVLECQGMKHLLQVTLDECVTGLCSQEDREAIHQAAEAVFGKAWKQ